MRCLTDTSILAPREVERDSILGGSSHRGWLTKLSNRQKSEMTFVRLDFILVRRSFLRPWMTQANGNGVRVLRSCAPRSIHHRSSIIDHPRCDACLTRPQRIILGTADCGLQLMPERQHRHSIIPQAIRGCGPRDGATRHVKKILRLRPSRMVTFQDEDLPLSSFPSQFTRPNPIPYTPLRLRFTSTIFLFCV
jgi:hypothetical protein